MFGIGWTEMVIIGVIALLVLGPEKLPDAARTLGKWVRELRAASAGLRDEFRDGFDDFTDARGSTSAYRLPSMLDEEDREPEEAGDAYAAADPVSGFGKPVRPPSSVEAREDGDDDRSDASG